MDQVYTIIVPGNHNYMLETLRNVVEAKYNVTVQDTETGKKRKKAFLVKGHQRDLESLASNLTLDDPDACSDIMRTITATT